MESSRPIEFSLNDQMPLRCGLTIVTGCLNLLLTAAVAYVVFLHPAFRSILRVDFNIVAALACLMQGLQSVVRILSASLLLQHKMTREWCAVTGTLDTSLETIALILMIGFYGCLMSIRLRPLRCLPVTLPKYFNEVAWAVTALVGGLLCGVLVNTLADDLTGANESHTPFGYTIGWCTLGENPILYFLTQGIPVTTYALISMIGYVVLRCAWGGGLRIRNLTWSSHWVIYVRLFGIALLMVLSFVFTFLVHYFGTEKHKLMSVSCTLAAIWPAGSAFLFLLSEGVFHEAPCTRWICSNDDEEQTLIRNEIRRSQCSHLSGDAEALRWSTPEFGLRAPGGGFTSALRTLLGLEIPGLNPITSTRRIEEQERRLFESAP